MSDLGYIVKLLDGVEVEWKELSEVATIGTGRSNRQDENENGKYPFYVRSKNILKSNVFQFDEIAIVVPGEGAIGDIFHYVEGKYALHQRAYRIHVTTDDINTKFLYYLMTDSFKKYILRKSVGATSISIRKPMLEKFLIPIPPLNTQADIVRILDTFTELTAELTAELVARKQQYAYYQEELLTFKDNVEWEELKEIVVFSQGIQVDTSKQFSEKSEGFVRFLRIVDFVKDNEPPRYIKNPGDKYVKDEGDLVMIRYGARAAGKVFLKYSGAIANNMFQIKLTTPKITIAYLHSYLSQQKIYNFLNSNGGNSTMPAITFGQIGAIKIPIPTLSEQERIVTIFNKFDALTTSLTEGLPREISLRQQQYEYYRELLLSFPKLEGKA